MQHILGSISGCQRGLVTVFRHNDQPFISVMRNCKRRRCLLLREQSLSDDDGVALGTDRDIGDAAADGLLDILDILLSCLGQILPLAGTGDVALPAGHGGHDGLCVGQNGGEGEVVDLLTVQLIAGADGDKLPEANKTVIISFSSGVPVIVMP